MGLNPMQKKSPHVSESGLTRGWGETLLRKWITPARQSVPGRGNNRSKSPKEGPPSASLRTEIEHWSQGRKRDGAHRWQRSGHGAPCGLWKDCVRGSTGGFGVARPAVVLDVTQDAGWRIHCRRDKTAPRTQVSSSGNWGWERSKDWGSLWR